MTTGAFNVAGTTRTGRPARPAHARRPRPRATPAVWRRVLPVTVAAGDGLAAGLAAVLAVRLRYGRAVPAIDAAEHRVGTGVVALVFAGTWLAVLALVGTYRHDVVASGPDELRRVLRAGLVLLGVVAVGHLLVFDDVSGRLVLLAVVLAVLATLAVRFAAERVAHHARARHRWVQRAVLYGSADETGALARRLATEPSLGVEVVGACVADEAPHPNGNGNGHRPPRGELDDVLGVMAATGADVLAVTAGTSPARLRSLAWALEGTGTDVLVAPAVADVAEHSLAAWPLAGVPLLRVEGCRLTRGRLLAKTVLDRVGAAVLLVLLAPVFAVTALAVRASGPGPVLYRQRRVGRDGATFTFLKFRTMTPGAEAHAAGLAERNITDGLLFKVPDDPRVTPVGRRLRRLSLDELPQLWNVLRGDMSLVGPRPLPVSPDAFVGDARRRLRVKPGITGLWQVSGRSELDWAETVRLDALYVDRWSLGLDLEILVRTPLAVVRGRGAY